MTTRFGLRLASGESGAEGEEERIANRSRSATPLPSRRRKPPLLRQALPMRLVTIARFAERNGRGREGEGADRSPWSVGIRAMVTVVNAFEAG
jgi:hypothetical protein